MPPYCHRSRDTFSVSTFTAMKQPLSIVVRGCWAAQRGRQAMWTGYLGSHDPVQVRAVLKLDMR
jgi:hypothetical protein